MKKKLLVVAGTLVTITMVAGITTSAVFGYKALKSVGTLDSKIVGLNEAVKNIVPEQDKNKKENDVIIGGMYKILSTEHISDAYKSGNTEELSIQDKKTLEMASDIIDEIIKNDMSDYEKELAVYEWLTTHVNNYGDVVISNSSEDSIPYGVLKNKSAVCVGYATTFRLFMQMLDIECMVVHSEELGHSWNLVKIEDDWYHTDCYFDAGTANYKSFNMDDNICASAHMWDREFFPAAAGTKYNYFYMNAKEVKDVFNIPKMIKEALDKKEKSIALKYTNTDLDDMNKNMGIIMKMMEQINNNIYNVLDGKEGYIETTTINSDYDTNIIAITITSFEENNTQSDYDEEVIKKIKKALKDAFGKSGWNMM